MTLTELHFTFLRHSVDQSHEQCYEAYIKCCYSLNLTTNDG